MKRITALAVCLLLILSVFAFTSCENGNSGTKDDAAKTQQDDGGKENGTDKTPDDDGGEKSKPALDIDVDDFIKSDPLEIPEDAKSLYEGRTFTLSVPKPWGSDIFVREALNDDPLNDSVYNMNAAVADKIGVTLKTTMDLWTHEQATAFIDSVLAGDHKFDVMTVHTSSNCGALVIADAVLDFDSLENIDLSKPWWNRTFTDQTSILGINYFGVSSSCYFVYLNNVVILFNKTLAEERNFPDLYELVRKGEWTIDKMIELTKNVSEDLDNNGIYDENDLLAMISDNGPHIGAWYSAFRQNTVERGENDEPVIVVNTPRVASIVDKLNTLYNTGRRTLIYNLHDHEHGLENDPYNSAFAEGRVLFDIAYVDVATQFRDYDIDFGILPMPKFNKEQEKYGSRVEAWHLCYAIPKNCPDPDYVSTVLETMAYYSYHLTYPAILRQVIHGTGTRDTESSEMLDLIYSNMDWDFGYVYAGGYSGMLGTLITSGSTDMASYIAQRKNTIEKYYADLYDAAIANAEK